MNINLNSETHPQAEIVAIILDKKTVDFKWVDGPYNGVCNCPYVSAGRHSHRGRAENSH